MSNQTERFWQQRAVDSKESIRWTGSGLLDEDVFVISEELRNLNTQGANWLDVGSGSGDLQSALKGRFGFCLATDAEPKMAKFYEEIDRTAFLCLPFQDLRGSGKFDLVTAFGLVTCLDQAQESILYSALSEFTIKGTVIVKNQVTDGEPITVKGFSEALSADYSGWYPNIDEQKRGLEKYFGNVDIHKYPVETRQHKNSFHVAFICKNSL